MPQNPAKNRTSSLTPLEQALLAVLASIPKLASSESVALEAALGRVLVDDCLALVDVPPHDNSAMDGYAVHSADLERVPVTLPVTQRIAAGQVGSNLARGEAARIFTGAPLPPGADAVVIQENCVVDDSGVRVLQGVKGGENVREAGDDMRTGSKILTRGRRLQAQDIGILAANGLTAVEVSVRPKVALMTTGDELVAPGTSLAAGQIYNSNAYALIALLAELGIEATNFGVVADTPEATRAALKEAAAGHDVVISTGGVSVGEEDHVKAAVEEAGSLDLWKLAIKPGKPFASGKVHGRQFFGLPGNPVSTFVTFLLLVRPALLTMQGCEDVAVRSFKLAAAFSRDESGDRQEYLRVSVIDDQQGASTLVPYSNQSSGVGASLSGADGLAIIPSHTAVTNGDLLTYLPFSELLN